MNPTDATDAFADETLAERTLDVLGARTWKDWQRILKRWPLDDLVRGQLAAWAESRDMVIVQWLTNGHPYFNYTHTRDSLDTYVRNRVDALANRKYED